MAVWKMTDIYVKRTYDISGVPDLQDSTSKRRRVVRPRTVAVYQVYGSNLVRYAVIEGRQIRVDGQGAERTGPAQILAGREEGKFVPYAEPPYWLEDLLEEEDLDWVRKREQPTTRPRGKS